MNLLFLPGEARLDPRRMQSNMYSSNRFYGRYYSVIGSACSQLGDIRQQAIRCMDPGGREYMALLQDQHRHIFSSWSSSGACNGTLFTGRNNYLLCRHESHINIGSNLMLTAPVLCSKPEDDWYYVDDILLPPVR